MATHVVSENENENENESDVDLIGGTQAHVATETHYPDHHLYDLTIMVMCVNV